MNDAQRKAVLDAFGTNADDVVGLIGHERAAALRGANPAFDAEAAHVAKRLNAGTVEDVVAAQAALRRMGVDADSVAVRQFMAERSIYGTNRQRPRMTPADYREIWEGAKVKDPSSPEFGRVFDERAPGGPRELIWDGKSSIDGIWDAGHIRGSTCHELHQQFLRGEISVQELVSQTTDVRYYRPEVPSGNRSRRNRE
ncbi:MAG: GH-E family nuclease [Gemmataceae bacterium]